MAEEKKRQYIKYAAEELAAVPSPYQMERELEQVWSAHGLGPYVMVDMAEEYRLLRLLGEGGYVAQKRLEAAVRSRHHHHHHHR